MYTTVALALGLLAVTADTKVQSASLRRQQTETVIESTDSPTFDAPPVEGGNSDSHAAPAPTTSPGKYSANTVEEDATLIEGMPGDEMEPHPMAAGGVWGGCAHCGGGFSGDLDGELGGPLGFGFFGPHRCGILRCGWNCRFKQWQGLPCIWRTTCDMPQHQPYHVHFRHYYYFRPYNYLHVPQQQEVVDAWGFDPRNPYDHREMFRDLYKGLDDLDDEIIETPKKSCIKDKDGDSDAEPSPGDAGDDSMSPPAPPKDDDDNKSGHRLRILR